MPPLPPLVFFRQHRTAPNSLPIASLFRSIKASRQSIKCGELSPCTCTFLFSKGMSDFFQRSVKAPLSRLSSLPERLNIHHYLPLPINILLAVRPCGWLLFAHKSKIKGGGGGALSQQHRKEKPYIAKAIVNRRKIGLQ